MNFKRFHESKNLWDEQLETGTLSENASPIGSTYQQCKLDTVSQRVRSANAIHTNGVATISFNNTKYNLFVLFFDDDALYTGIYEGWKTDTFTVNSPYIGIVVKPISGNISPDADDFNIMINSGSQPLPYEPYGGTWHDTPHYIHNTSTDTITTLPAVLYPNAATATVGLKGNTVQNGTPTPDNPIMPQGTGERTGNLFAMEAVTDSAYINSLGEITYNYAWAVSDYISIESLTSYTISRITDQSTTTACHAFYDANKSLISTIQAKVSTQTFETPTNAKYIRCSWRSAAIQQVMLNTGSTALPYENFGYKIPILNNSQTTNVYLGEVQSTRRIKKLVLTGEESWELQSINSHGIANFRIYNSLANINDDRSALCSHFYQSTATIADVTEPCFSISLTSPTLYIRIRSTTASDTIEFKTWLAQQYAAGTPVCVWYVLAEPTTGIVNEPIRKIGDYADTVSGITIPTTAGANTISIGTTLQPSEVTVNYKGWHPVQSVHERESDAWT